MSTTLTLEERISEAANRGAHIAQEEWEGNEVELEAFLDDLDVPRDTE